MPLVITSRSQRRDGRRQKASLAGLTDDTRLIHLIRMSIAMKRPYSCRAAWYILNSPSRLIHRAQAFVDNTVRCHGLRCGIRVINTAN